MAVEVYNQEPEKHTSFIGIEQLDKLDSYNTQLLRCKGCENNCSISKFSFKNGNFFYSGNQCEKIYTNKGSQFEKGFDMFEYKYNLIFKQPAKPSSKPLMRIGIPRVLNVYENFPFWNTLLTECNIELILSTHSSTLIYEKGSGSIMSDSICFPAKLVHGHIFDLVDKKVDRIFYPMVFFEEKELKAADNSYNCPIVSSYADVIRSSINTELKYNIPFDSPVINFSDISLLKEACYTYLRTLGVSKSIFNEAFTKSLEMREKIRQNIKSKAKEIISMAHTENRLVILLAGRPYHFDPLINHKSPQILSEMGVDVLTEDCLPFTEEDKNEKIQTISQWTYPNRIYKAAQWIAKQPNNFQFVQLNSFGCGPDVIVTDESSEILKTKGKNHTLIRIDEITSTGSIRLRLRSMIESLRLRDKNYTGLKKIRITTAPFQEKDKQRIILAPMFAEMYSHYLPSLFKLAGYTLINLPKPDKESVEYGLKYTNNEICYPATIVVGDVIKALLSGQYDLSAVAIGITQSGGQCRASSYLALIKKAMVNAGFSDVPVISVNSGNTENDQPGFRIEWDKMLNTVFVNVIYADSLAKLYYSTVVREKNKGDAQKLYNQFAELSYNCILTKDATGFFNLIEKAVEEFNKIPVYDKKYPQIGIVGEIYVKYNAFGHQNIVEWLIEQGIEVVVPPILDFFIQGFVNYDVNKKNFLMKVSFKSNIFLYFLEKKSNYYIRKANKILSKYKYYSPLSNIREIAHGASEILSLTNQFGEGWLIPAEISEFAKMGINNVVSVQPFGCIANQVISKGVEKRIKDLYPQMSLLYLDFDDGVSPVNIINRLHFMVKNVKD
jgi:predicted nucleotide-binding protein (sugar kinase/HSP70/actin superfamily)